MLDGALYTDARARRARLAARARPCVGTLPVGSHPMEGGARRGKPVPRPWGGGARRTELPSTASALGARGITVPNELTKEGLRGGSAPPNGPRLSCGRRARRRTVGRFDWRHSVGAQMEFYPTCARPPASSAC